MNIELQKLTNIFEFGGGYGCMARIFSKINYKISYKIFDTYLVNCLQYYYLKQNGLEVGFENNRFDLINNFEKINDKVDLKNSLFIANWSLSEVPLDLRDKFVSLIERYENIMISFQENFEDINNLKYFKNFQENLKHLCLYDLNQLYHLIQFIDLTLGKSFLKKIHLIFQDYYYLIISLVFC